MPSLVVRFRPGLGATARLLVAALAASLVEGIETARATAAAHERASILPAAWEAFSAVLLPSLVVALALGALFSARSVRRATAGLRRAIAAEDGARGMEPFAFALLAAAVSIALSIGRRSAARVTSNVALSLAIVALLVTLVVGAPLVLVVASWFGRRTARFRGRLRPRLLRSLDGYRGLLPAALSTSLLVLAVRPLFPETFLPTLSGAIIGYCLSGAGVLRISVARALGGVGGRRGHRVLLALVLLALPAPFLLGVVPAPARLIVLYRSPLTGSILTALRSLVDRDHDGYSPILLGGDCNDHDATINPGANDVPGNGIDENCSGADATPFVPYRQPAQQMQSLPALPKHPNIVLVLIDALRPDHLHFAGYARNTSPNLDAFRREATWFKNAYTAASSTRFALASVMTGLDVDAIPQVRSRTDLEIAPGAHLLGERFNVFGYDRVGYTISYVIQHIRGVGGGFRLWEPPWPVDEWKENFAVSATRTTDAGLGYLASVPPDGTKPYLLLLHYRCTHDPYAANARWPFGSSPMDAYDSALAYCDDEIGRFLRGLQARKDSDKTALFVFSDHGELFGEHGFTQHGSSVFQPDVRVLLLAKLPFLRTAPAQARFGSGAEIDTPVSLTDLEPTLVTLGGGVDTDTHAWNLLPLLAHGDSDGDPSRPLFLYTDLTRGTVRHQARGALQGRLKYVRDLTTGTTGLYDVVADPDESHDVSRQLGPDRARLADLLESWERGAATAK